MCLWTFGANPEQVNPDGMLTKCLSPVWRAENTPTEAILLILMQEEELHLYGHVSLFYLMSQAQDKFKPKNPPNLEPQVLVLRTRFIL